MPTWDNIWQQPTPPWWTRVIARGFAGLAWLRRYAYRWGILHQTTLPLPVIVVGNLTVGGTGKTPVVLFLAQALRAAGWQPIIISRGYGGRVKHPTRVCINAPAREVGDEPLLLAQRSGCPVWVGSQRVLVAQAAIKALPNCDVIISDDGLQHYALGRQLSVAVFDAARGIGNGYLLPAGRLREPLSQLATVDAVLVQGEGEIPQVKADFRFYLQAQQAYALLAPTRRIDLSTWTNQRVAAVAGIGDPSRFFKQLMALGISFTPYAFPDHHAFCATDLPAEAEIIVMTEKDAVKCRAFADERCMVLPVTAHFCSNFAEWIITRLEMLA